MMLRIKIEATDNYIHLNKQYKNINIANIA